jgi:hypothetical protein
MSKIGKHISPFLIYWLIVVSISICIAVFLASPLGDFLYKHNGRGASASNDGDLEYNLSYLILVALFMGFGEWVAINNKIKGAYRWILATFIGCSIGAIVPSYVLYHMLSFLYLKHYVVLITIVTVGALVGAGMFTGFCQWLSLKREMTGALKWSLVNGVSFLINLLPSSLITGYPADHPVAWPISIVISVVLFAVISGYFAERLIVRPEVEKYTGQEIAI